MAHPESTRRSTATLLLASTLVSLVWWSSQHVGLNHDSPGLLADWQLIRNGAGTTYYPPGYPVLLGLTAATGLLPPAGLVTLAQHTFGVVATWWTFQILRRFAAPRFAAIAALALHLFPASLAANQAVCSEAVANHALVGALRYGLRWHDTGRVQHAVVAGALAALAGVTRVTPLAAFAVAWSLLCWCSPQRRRLRAWVAGTLVAAAGPVAAATWFLATTGHFCLANSTGGHLFNRVVNEQGLVAADGAATARLRALVGEPERGRCEHSEIRVRLESTGLAYGEATALLGDVAAEGLASGPLRYCGYSLWQAGVQLFRNPEMPIGDEFGLAPPGLQWTPLLGHGAALDVPVRRLRGGQAIAWPAIVVLAIAGGAALLRRRPIAPVIAWLAAAPATLVAQALVEQSLPRYSVPLLPFVLPLAVLGCIEAWTLWANRRRGQN